MSFFAGLILGFLVLLLPPLYWAKELPKVPADAFYEQQPDKRFAYFILYNLPFIWLLLYVIVVIPFIFQPLGTGPIVVFFAGYLLGAGLSMGDGLAELLTGVTVVRRLNFSRTPSRRGHFVHGPAVRALGRRRTGLVALVGLASALVLIVFFWPV